MQKIAICLISFLFLTASYVSAHLKPFFESEFLDLKNTFFSSAKKNNNLNIYLDADRSNHFASAHSIELGVKLAFSEIGYQVFNKNINFIILDHHGNTARVQKHLRQFLKDENAIAYFSGIHSPPLIKLRSFINENSILTLVPWAAGGPITRYPGENNFVFRLSVDDTKAGYVITKHSIEKQGCQNIHLLLEETGWGDSNLKTMNHALAHYGMKAKVTRFNWNLQDLTARKLVRDIIAGGADCIQLVANAVEGERFANAMLSFEAEKRIPIISHWGIVAGDFHKNINAEKRKGLDLNFIQTCFSFVSSSLNKLQEDVLERAIRKFSCIHSAKDILAPDGFIHAYDLSRILIQAMSQVEYNPDHKVLRSKIKLALEDLERPVEGLLKAYDKPFREFSLTDVDAHEALNMSDFCMASYGKDDEILILE